jgi:hypothetical protein
MKRLALLLLVLTVSVGSFGQRKLASAINKDSLDWSVWEVQMSEEEKLALIDKLKTSEGIENGLKHYTYSIWNLRDKFHIVDFNRDGYHDIIYNGFAGHANNGIMFFENRDGKFVKFKELYGDIVEIWRSDTWVPLSFKVWNYRCCGNYVDFLETYVPELNYEHTVKYVLSNKIAFVDGMAFPDTFNMSRPLDVIAEPVRLYLAPTNDTTHYKFYYTDKPTTGNLPKNRLFHYKGNMVAAFGPGGKGLVLAEKEIDGQTWYFVRMSRYQVLSGVFCAKGHNNGSAAYMLGWMTPEGIEFVKMGKAQ